MFRFKGTLVTDRGILTIATGMKKNISWFLTSGAGFTQF